MFSHGVMRFFSYKYRISSQLLLCPRRFYRIPLDPELQQYSQRVLCRGKNIPFEGRRRRKEDGGGGSTSRAESYLVLTTIIWLAAGDEAPHGTAPTYS